MYQYWQERKTSMKSVSSQTNFTAFVQPWNLHDGKTNSRSCPDFHTHAMAHKHTNNINDKISPFLLILSITCLMILQSYLFFLLYAWNRVSVCSLGCPWSSIYRPSWPQTQNALPASASWALELKACVPPCQATIIFLGNKSHSKAHSFRGREWDRVSLSSLGCPGTQYVPDRPSTHKDPSTSPS